MNKLVLAIAGAGAAALGLFFWQRSAQAAEENSVPTSDKAPFTVTTSQTGPTGRLKVRSSPDASNGDGNVIGSLEHGASLYVTSGAETNGFSPVDVSGSSNASGVGEPGGTPDGSWAKGTTGYVSNASISPVA